MARPATLALAALLCVAAQAVQYAFKADFVYRHENMGAGFAKGTMYYRYDTTTPKNAVVVYKYTEPTEISIYKVPADERIYKKCTKCEGADKPGLTLPPLRAQDLTCNEQGGLFVCTDGGGSTLKQAVFASSDAVYPQEYNLTDGKHYSLSNQDTSLSYSDDVFTVKEEWDCGNCVAMLDLFFLLDGSGSIGKTNWQKMLTFVSQVVSRFTLAETATAVSIITWHTSTFVPWPLNAYHYLSEISQKTVPWETYASSWAGTIQSLGFEEMDKQLQETSKISGNSRWLHKETKPTIVAVVVTDGVDHYPTRAKNSANKVKNTYGAYVVEVSVGSRTDPDFMKEVATQYNGKPLFYHVDDFEGLIDLTGDIVQLSCSYDKSEDKCGDQCDGFCGCEAQCHCPVCDDYPTECGSYQCSESSHSCDLDLHFTCIEDECSTKTCNSATGTCDSQERVCEKKTPDGSLCYCAMNTCDPEKGCGFTPVKGRCPAMTCMDVVECDCDQNGDPDYPGCIYQNRTCDTGIECLWGYCDVSTDTCMSRTHCAKATKCDPMRCNEETQECESDPVVKYCEQRYCSEPYCEEDSKLLCSYKPVDCAELMDDHDPCKLWTCHEENKTCTYELIPGCVSCGDVECTDVPKCRVATCKAGDDGKPVCDYSQIIENNCTMGGLCTTGYCDESETGTGTCVYTSTCPEGNKCQEPVCHSNGTCTLEYRQGKCEDDGPCSKCICDNDTGVYYYKSPCPAPNCTTVTCTLDENNQPHCSEPVRRECTILPEFAGCNEAFCNDETNECDMRSKCDDNDPCTIDACENGQCVHKKPSDTNCKIAVCNPALPEAERWYYVNKCNTTEFCRNLTCVEETGECQVIDYPCTIELPDMYDYPCFKRACSESRHCYRKLIEDVVIDICGNCLVPSVDDGSISKVASGNNQVPEEPDTEACVQDFVMPPTQAALTGGVIAAIVIGCAVAVAGLTAGGVFGTKALIKRAKDAAGQGAQMNPLYEADSREASNPMYEATK